MQNVRIAYQLYSAREEAAKDLSGVLKTLRDQGYDGLIPMEFPGKPKHYKKIFKNALLLRRASLEHDIHYKADRTKLPAGIDEEMLACAEKIAEIDRQMQDMYRRIADAEANADAVKK